MAQSCCHISNLMFPEPQTDHRLMNNVTSHFKVLQFPPWASGVLSDLLDYHTPCSLVWSLLGGNNDAGWASTTLLQRSSEVSFVWVTTRFHQPVLSRSDWNSWHRYLFSSSTGSQTPTWSISLTEHPTWTSSSSVLMILHVQILLTHTDL